MSLTRHSPSTFDRCNICVALEFCSTTLCHIAVRLGKCFTGKNRQEHGKRKRFTGYKPPRFPGCPPVMPCLWTRCFIPRRVECWATSLRRMIAARWNPHTRKNPHTRRKQRILCKWSCLPIRKVSYSIEATWIWGEPK